MICGVVATSSSGCDVCIACRVVCDCSRTVAHYTARRTHTHHSLKYLLPERRISYKDVLSLINSTILLL